ncbi:Uncharacterised protein [Aggregatibacter aphrophilus ATCC 33389]|uniref:Uncharacterized protein n=1 Tax=Aggregatibacter aphrophilus ATCC 33389 TaxID=985008 RepID=A0A448F9N0_AGGAP|nr:Uncharacterised protein [Aggregatibacter aphrophilus ATCC 33389]
MKYSSFTPETLNTFLQQHTATNNTFELLEGLCYWLRQCEPQQVVPALRLIKYNLKENKPLARALHLVQCFVVGCAVCVYIPYLLAVAFWHGKVSGVK